MDKGVIAAIITGVLGLMTGTIGLYFVNRILEIRREFLSTKRNQLSEFYSPMEMLMRINHQEFERYFGTNTTNEDKVYIEKEIWYPNNKEIRKIIIEKGHLLPEVPEEILKLLAHINVWLSEYDAVYVRNEKEPPVFAGPKGYPYPEEADTYITEKSAELRGTINRNG